MPSTDQEESRDEWGHNLRRDGTVPRQVPQEGFCSCERESQMCCGFCCRCLDCNKKIFWAELEVAYQLGTRHDGEYEWGDLMLHAGRRNRRNK